MERLINGHLTPTDIQTMGSHKLFYVHSLPIPESILAAAKKVQANEYHASWNKPEIYATHMVELLISQAGMMPGDPFGRGTSKVEYYFVTDNPNAPQCFYFRHHIDFYKYVFGDPSRRPSGGEDWWSWDLLLMGRYHFSRMMQESTKNLDYYSWARGLKNGFMHGRCPDYWTHNQKVKYYSRLYDIIAEWMDPSIRLENKFLDPKFSWFKINVKGKGFLTIPQLIKDKIIDKDFIDNLIEILMDSIQKQGFKFDAPHFSSNNRDEFLNHFL